MVAQYPRMTYEEYQDDPAIDEHTEWVAGEVVTMMSVSRVHAELQMFLVEILQSYLRRSGVGRLYVDPFQMKVAPDLNGRAPDIMLVRNDHLGRLKDKHLEGPADLVIEIVSPGTEGIDRGDKFVEYEQGGVPEYWILDPLREIAEFYRLDAAGIYRAANADADGVYESLALDGLRLHTEWFWERPPVAPILAELGLS
jgi:Uma2 family endonuclease